MPLARQALLEQRHPAAAACRPYSADRLSPTTRIAAPSPRAPCAASGNAADGRAPAASAVQCASQRRRVTIVRRKSSSFMSEPIIDVERLTKQVSDSTGTLTILHDIDFRLARARSRRRSSVRRVPARARCCRSSPASTRRPAAPCDWPAPTCSRSTRTRGPRSAPRKVGFVFQSFQLLGNLNALENVMLPLELQGRRDARTLATEMLGRVGLGERLRHYPRCCRAASSSAWRWPAPSSSSPRCCWPTSRPAASTSRPARRVMELMFDLEPRGRHDAGARHP